MRDSVEVPSELDELRRFHGHLGPYVTIGFLMGQIARRELGEHRGMTAVVSCSLVPPTRCLVDGVQMGSSCTFGKGNIKLRSASNPRVTFEKAGKRLTVSLRPGLRQAIDSEMSKAGEVEQSLRYYRMAEADLFDISLV